MLVSGSVHMLISSAVRYETHSESVRMRWSRPPRSRSSSLNHSPARLEVSESSVSIERWSAVMKSRFRLAAWPFFFMAETRSRTFCLFFSSSRRFIPEPSSASLMRESVSRRLSMSSRESRSRSMLSRSWLRTKSTVDAQRARLAFCGASRNSPKNWVTVPEWKREPLICNS